MDSLYRLSEKWISEGGLGIGLVPNKRDLNGKVKEIYKRVELT